MRTLCIALLLLGTVSAQQWGAPVRGLRIAVAVEKNAVVFSFHNTQPDREMFLALGRTVGIGRAEFVRLDLIATDGTRRALQYTGGSGVAPGRLLPYIVPMMPGSVYTVRTPLLYWRVGSNLRRIEEDLRQGASLQARISVEESFEWQHVNCYGLRMFWSGQAVSNVFPR